MAFPLAGIIGGMIATRSGHAIASGFSAKSALQTFARSPIIQGGQFGVGYTAGSYGGYGASNTWDPFGIHTPKYKSSKQSLGMPYGYGYGRRRYRRRYGYSRYSSYRSRYGRRRPYYRRRYY